MKQGTIQLAVACLLVASYIVFISAGMNGRLFNSWYLARLRPAVVVSPPQFSQAGVLSVLWRPQGAVGWNSSSAGAYIPVRQLYTGGSLV